MSDQVRTRIHFHFVPGNSHHVRDQETIVMSAPGEHDTAFYDLIVNRYGQRMGDYIIEWTEEIK